MNTLTVEKIKNNIADSMMIYHRGETIYEQDGLFLKDSDGESAFLFMYDGNYGDYTISIDLEDVATPWLCDCPYPGDACKHIVAALLNVVDHSYSGKESRLEKVYEVEPESEFLSPDDLRKQALESREKSAKTEYFQVVVGETLKGEHLLYTKKNKEYKVVIHNPETGKGHCSCPDFLTNKLGTCKHLNFMKTHLKGIKNYKKQVANEVFPFADIFWNSQKKQPELYYDDAAVHQETSELLKDYFDNDGSYKKDFKEFTHFYKTLQNNKQIIVQPSVIRHLQERLENMQLVDMENSQKIDYSIINADLYEYQKEGVKFGLFKKSVLIGDEMGLGKTLQAITLSVLKRELFGFKNVLVVTLASLKDQWYREISKFTDETSVVVAGTREQRKRVYQHNRDYFKITNYEAVLRDITIISDMKPDIIILDEAQRIKNFNTKTADAVKTLPKDHAIVLTGTPLENKLEDVYSIVQFLDPFILTPLWDFAGRYYVIPKSTKGKITGYKNLKNLQEVLSSIVIRRKKEEVIEDLPETITNNYFIDLSHQQEKMHLGFWSALLPILGKKFLTPLDMQQIHMLLLKMRMACNSTYLIDKKTNISPKLKEFESIINDLVIENNRKVVVFSEWTTMTFLIAKYLSKAGIPFVELSGKIPVKKRQKLIDEFTNNPDCKIFLSTDAGGTGLNLQAADCVINLELPWNPAKLNQRTGRVNRIGQKSKCINVINLIAKRSIEEKILSGIQMKTDLFKGVFDDDGEDFVDFSNSKKASLVNRLREMMGEEPDEVPAPELKETVEIPDDMPHFLNPKVLSDDKEETAIKELKEVNIAGEEKIPALEDSTQPEEEARDSQDTSDDSIFANQSPEKIEEVLNKGMAFVGSLLEMATGKPIEKSEGEDKLLKIDRTTGEVTMKFKLPGL